MPVALFPGRPDAEDRTRTLGEESPTSSLPTAPPVSPTLVQPARAPFVTPQPPAQGYPANWRPLPRGVPRLQRAAVLLGTFALATVAVARAPYLSTAGLAVLALLVRTYSWTTESSRDRKYRRGRARWYDGPLTLVTTPWYLVVATGGTLLLLAGSALTALVVGVAYGLFRLPLVPGLLLVGGVFSVALWWGPGSRRLRMPGRSLVARATRRRWIGWLSVTLLAAGAALCAYGLAHTGVVWAPADGPPWRSGTALGDLVRWL
jgi:hypothetical protein